MLRAVPARPKPALRDPRQRDVVSATGTSLDDRSGTLVATFTATRCPPGNAGHANTVDFTWAIDGGASTGTFAGSTGGGTGVNITAGNVQVVSLTGSITLT